MPTNKNPWTKILAAYKTMRATLADDLSRMGSSSTNGGRIGVNCPAGATIEYQVWANLGSVGTSLMAKGIDSGGAESNTVASGGTGVSSFAFFITGSIKTGATAGTVQLNARSMAGGNSFYIYAGAAVKAERIN